MPEQPGFHGVIELGTQTKSNTQSIMGEEEGGREGSKEGREEIE